MEETKYFYPIITFTNWLAPILEWCSLHHYQPQDPNRLARIIINSYLVAENETAPSNIEKLAGLIKFVKTFLSQFNVLRCLGDIGFTRQYPEVISAITIPNNWASYLAAEAKLLERLSPTTPGAWLMSKDELNQFWVWWQWIADQTWHWVKTPDFPLSHFLIQEHLSWAQNIITSFRRNYCLLSDSLEENETNIRNWLQRVAPNADNITIELAIKKLKNFRSPLRAGWDKALQTAMKETGNQLSFWRKNLDPTPFAQMPDDLSLIGESLQKIIT